MFRSSPLRIRARKSASRPPVSASESARLRECGRARATRLRVSGQNITPEITKV